MVIFMDETIGVKGGKNDRRRSIKIRQARKRKLEQIDAEQEKLYELEKKVRRAQFYTLIKTLPIVLGGGVVQNLYEASRGKKEDLEEKNSQWRIKEYDQDISPLTPEEFEIKKRKTITTPSGEKVVVYVKTYEFAKKKSNPSLDDAKKLEKTFAPQKSEKQSTSMSKKKANKGLNIDIGDDSIDIETFFDADLSNFDLSSITPEAQSKINLIQSRKIIEGYEKELKEIRFELRILIFQYNALVDQGDEAVISRDAEIIIEKLSELIDKVEELKQRIRLDNLNQYSGDYINGVISGYIGEVEEDKMIQEIKNSPLYMSLKEKLDELSKKQGKFSDKMEDKKDAFEEKEMEFDRLKDKYFSIEKINAELARFQYEQDMILKEIQKKVDEAETVTEKVRIEFEGMNLQSRRLRRLFALQMFLPGLRFAKGATMATAAYLYGIRQLINPRTKSVPYTVIEVIDYHNEITGNINAIEDAISQLTATSSQIDSMIEEIKAKFGSYLENLAECRELLRNLNRIKGELADKEDELKLIKEKQEKELERNDVKVKKRGEYPVN